MGQTLLSDHYTLNADGTRSSLSESQLQSGGSTVTTITNYSYDALDRLTAVFELNESTGVLDYSDIYTYDLSNNRMSDTHTTASGGTTNVESIAYAYYGTGALHTETGTLNGSADYVTTYAYDANGSEISMTRTGSSAGTTTYTYDVRNRMASVTSGTVTTMYVYDNAGNRVQETTGGVTTYWLTDTVNPTGYAQPIEQRSSATSAPTESYIIGNRVLGQISNANGATVSYLMPDGHGSTSLLADASGNVTADFSYDAFGGAIGNWLSTAWTVFLFGGDAVYDAASGLYLHGDGIRDTQGFRFTQMDTANGSYVYPIALHKYLYAWADPINMWDPSGHDGIGVTLHPSATFWTGNGGSVPV